MFFFRMVLILYRKRRSNESENLLEEIRRNPDTFESRHIRMEHMFFCKSYIKLILKFNITQFIEFDFEYR